MTGISILKLQFYSSDMIVPREKLASVGVLLPLLAAAAVLLGLFLRRSRSDGLRNAEMRMVCAAFGLLVSSKVVDRLPAVLREWSGMETAAVVVHSMQELEEGIELLLPVLFVASYALSVLRLTPKQVSRFAAFDNLARGFIRGQHEVAAIHADPRVWGSGTWRASLGGR